MKVSESDHRGWRGSFGRARGNDADNPKSFSIHLVGRPVRAVVDVSVFHQEMLLYSIRPDESESSAAASDIEIKCHLW